MPSVKLYAYGKALESIDACEVVARDVVGPRPDLADQLRRAATSVALNLAEGANEYSLRDKVRLYRIARRSAAEVEAALEIIGRLRLSPSVEPAMRANARVLALLTRLIASLVSSKR